MSSSLSKAKKSTSNIQVATYKVEFNVSLCSPVDLLASKVQLPKEVAVIKNLFGDTFLPSIE